jgi:hypothetical protein
LQLARARRPFHLERVAGEASEIEIRLERECMHGFPALLTQGREGDEWAFGDETGFLVEFSSGARQQIPRFDIPFGNGPRAVVLVAPIRAPGMREQEFESRLAAKNKNAGADFGSA